MVLETGQATERGRRPENQDAVWVDAGAGCAAIADGMGGPPGGGVASRIALEVARELLAALPLSEQAPEPELLRRVFAEAGRRIFEAAQQTGRRGMGTTLVLLTVRGGRYTVAHAGDSRAYRISAGALARLTRDHSLVQEEIEAGLLRPEEARLHPLRNVITRAVGVEPWAEPEVSGGPVEPGEVFVLTTDGVHGAIPDARIGELAWRDPPELAARALVREALDLGSDDNATAAVLRVVLQTP